MAPMAARHVWCFALLYLVKASWLQGDAGESCDAVCSKEGKTCSVAGTRQLNTQAGMEYLAGQHHFISCKQFVFVSNTASPIYDSQPFQFTLPGFPEDCYLQAGATTCAASHSNAKRFCCCLPDAGASVAEHCSIA
mmetsp:Transcript_62540/g.116994  ORF Transcript_62540/g.116994 Transcript_62540/m.116994 type:complete len:136 (-) Transcript_62540:89-496(-)